jgi:hypothetical protein
MYFPLYCVTKDLAGHVIPNPLMAAMVSKP